MFEQTGTWSAIGDSGAAADPPAMHAVSTSSQDVTAGPAPMWREALPGPEMIAALASVSLQTCSDEQLLDVLAGWQRVEAWVAAQQTRALARTQTRLLETATREFTDLDGHTPWEAIYRQVETEISTALRWTSRFTGYRLQTAEQLTDRLPGALDALAAGQLTYRHAEMICDETTTLTDPQARQLLERLLPEASTKTVGGLRRRLRTAVLQLDPAAGNERALRAVTERSVTIRPLPDGLAQLQAVGPAAAILGMFRTLDDTADRHPKGDPRTRTARRFDALTDLVLTSAQQGRQDCPPAPTIPALVQITLDLPTLLGLQNNPAELHGYGPLPAALARALAVNADWQRFLQDPITGAPHDLGRTRRHPDADLRRWIIARDRTCLFPECYRPAADCEPDHNPAWEHHGRTDKDQLHQLCPKHHKVRHHGWRYQPHPDRITWTSPHQQTYERYLNEADLIRPADACPHPDDSFEDSIWSPTDDDQQIDRFLPGNRRRQIYEFQPPAEDIPWHIVEAFRLAETDTWPLDIHGNPVEEIFPTPEEEQAILDTEDRLIYGDPIDPDTISSRALLDKARRKQHTHYPHPDEPPPF